MSVQILTDSTSYIDKNIIKELGIKVVSLSVTFGDESFKEEDLDNEKFYEMMDSRGIPISSQPSASEIYDVMKNAVEAGDSLLGIFMSSDMSGTFSTANLVRNMILEENKDAKIEILDSRSNSMQLGYAVIIAARAAREGKSLEVVKDEAIKNIMKSRFIFIPENLEYLKKGGRIGGASALIGSLFKIIPVLTVQDGKTAVLAKVRTKKKALEFIMEKMIQDIETYGLGEITVHHINCLEEAKTLADIINENLGVDASICDIGPVIGLHVGPGALGLVYYTQKVIN